MVWPTTSTRGGGEEAASPEAVVYAAKVVHRYIQVRQARQDENDLVYCTPGTRRWPPPSPSPSLVDHAGAISLFPDQDWDVRLFRNNVVIDLPFSRFDDVLGVRLPTARVPHARMYLNVTERLLAQVRFAEGFVAAEYASRALSRTLAHPHEEVRIRSEVRSPDVLPVHSAVWTEGALDNACHLVCFGVERRGRWLTLRWNLWWP